MKKMLIDADHEKDIRVAIVEKNSLIDYESEKKKNDRIKGNIYLAKIIRVEPSLQAAFVDYGGNKHGFLAYNEIHPDYFKIPTADKKKLLEQELEQSKKNLIDADDDEFLDESFDENRETSLSRNETDNKGFLNRVFDFFNYKPLEDYSGTRIKKKKFKKNIEKKNKAIIYHRKYSIQEVIKSNQVILIQVVKEERGNKGAAVTTRLSLAGKYCVLMPNTNKGGGISRKIIEIKLRKKLKELVGKLNIKSGMGVIIRTAGQAMGLKEIKRDYSSLIKLWNEITSKTIKSNAPCLIHEEDNIIKRFLRDYFDASYEEALINDKKIHQKSKEIVKQFMPQSVKNIKLYKEKKPIFFSYGVERKIIEINNPIVHLRSGGYLVINQTEALVAIDINSGKFTKQRNIEDTAFKTNLEAAEEISRQIRIRDLAGLIVIDFIDMLDRNHNVRVERRLREFVKNDRARIQIGRISNFGLLELSRQRLKVIEDSRNSSKCDHCNGYGNTLSVDFIVDQILRVYYEYLSKNNKEKINIICNERIGNLIKIENNEKSIFYKKYKTRAFVKIHNDLNDQEFFISKDNEVLIKNSNKPLTTEDFKKLEKLTTIKNNIEQKLKDKRIIVPDESATHSKNNFKDGEQHKTNESSMPLKRKSYRAKAEDFNLHKKSNSSKTNKIKRKISLEGEKIDLLKKKTKEEKRQGWWSQ